MKTFYTRLFISITLLSFAACTSAQFKETMNGVMKGEQGLTSSQIEAGLKEALEKGAGYAVEHGSGLNSFLDNPMIKIPFPPEVADVQKKLNSVGMTSVTERFVATLNHAAETASAEAKPVFVDAIRSMTLKDALGILNGPSDAATQYLKRVTSARLQSKFSPIVKKATDQVELTRYWTPVMTAYNALPFSSQKTNPDLNAYVTDRALSGLFSLVAEEEGKIRSNPVERTTELLKKVFAK